MFGLGGVSFSRLGWGGVGDGEVGGVLMEALSVSTLAARASSLVAASSICAAETWARSWRRTGVAWVRAVRPRRRRVGSFMVVG